MICKARTCLSFCVCIFSGKLYLVTSWRAFYFQRTSYHRQLSLFFAFNVPVPFFFCHASGVKFSFCSVAPQWDIAICPRKEMSNAMNGNRKSNIHFYSYEIAINLHSTSHTRTHISLWSDGIVKVYACMFVACSYSHANKNW